jgi:alpha-L-fucosidase
LQNCGLTQSGKKLYVHVFAWPFKHLHLPGLGGRVEFARFLHDGSEVPLTGSDWETRQLTLGPDDQLLFLPVKKPDVIVPMIELILN